MAENTKGRHLLTDADFVDVVDADGNDLPAVPSHWGKEDLPAGAKKKKSGKADKASKGNKGSQSSTGGSTSGSDSVPSGGASREAWAEYAKSQGAPEEETKSQDDGGLGRDALRDKYKPAKS